MVRAIVDWFNNVFGWLIDVVSHMVDGVPDRFSRIDERIDNDIQMAQEIIEAVWSYIEDTFQNALDFILALVEGDFEGMKNAIQNQMENAKNLLENIWNAIDKFLSKTLGNIWTNVKEKFTDIKN